jgi:hypothetical protein
MASVTLHLAAETEQKLRAKAALTGQTLVAYLEQLADRDAQGKGDSEVSAPDLSDEEFDRLLNELSEGPTLPHLPADFSRSDVYADHD